MPRPYEPQHSNPMRTSSGAKTTSPPWRPWLLIALASTAAALAGRSMLQAVDGRLYDIGITSQKRAAPAEIAIAGLDEEFMRGRHAYLTPRDRLAKLIEVLAEAKPAVIAVDVWLDSRIDDAPGGVDAQLRRALLDAKKRGLPVLLAGMLAPPNLGADYGREFAGIFQRLAKAHPKVVFYPFLLEGVAGDPALNQPDRIHPNPQGAEEVARRMLPAVRELLSKVQGG